MTMASTSNTWTRPTRSKMNAMVPAIVTNNGSGTGSVVSSATISVMPSLLPASSTNCVRLDPVCAHSTNRLLRGLNSTLPVSDSLGWSCTISSMGGTCAPQHSHLTRSLDLLSSTMLPFCSQQMRHRHPKNRSNHGGWPLPPMLEVQGLNPHWALRIRQWGPGFFASPTRTPRKPYLALILRTCRVCPFVTQTG